MNKAYLNPARLQLTDYVGTAFQLEKLIFPDNFDMYISHLRSLNLIDSSGVKQDFIYDNDNPKKQIGTKNKLAIFPTDFGLLFLRACLTT